MGALPPRIRAPHHRPGPARSGALAAALIWLAACGGAGGPTNPLYVDPGSRDFGDNPKLLERILSSPHGYFRFVNPLFSNEVCRRFRTAVGSPPVNLHGDAHLEQYAVTDLGRGLTDFDDSSTGPAVVDLLRFTTSLRLASRTEGLETETERLIGEFLDSYDRALAQPQGEIPEPQVSRRIRSTFSYDREAYLRWVESIMEPIEGEETEGLAVALEPYFEMVRRQHPEIEPGFFSVQDLGRLRMGIGSALDLKYLARIRGATDSRDDDVILEIKEVRDLSDIDCITVVSGPEPLRILIGQSRIAYQPYRFLGYARLREHTFWVHAWVDNYQEVEIGKTFRSLEELAGVVRDVGVQLGRGHPNQIAAPHDEPLRRELRRFLSVEREKIRSASLELADLTEAAWRRFRQESGGGGPGA